MMHMISAGVTAPASVRAGIVSFCAVGFASAYTA